MEHLELTTQLDSLIETMRNSKLFHNETIFFMTQLKQHIYESSKTIDKLQSDIDVYQNALCTSLKNMIGQNIYWANPNWRYETHTITNVRCDILDTDFFDTPERTYDQTKCVIIDIDNEGYYIANNIGHNQFFNKNEAISHSKYPEGDDL